MLNKPKEKSVNRMANKMTFPNMTAVCRGSLFWYKENPYYSSVPTLSYEWIEDGILGLDAGQIVLVGSAQDLLQHLPQSIHIHDYRGSIIMPGFIDAHVHYPQINMIASYGEQLIDWLNLYAFPEEMRFTDAEYALYTARYFVKELLKNGTTTASVFTTVHPQSVDAFFSVAEQYSLRMVAGKVMMDRHAPEVLCEEMEEGIHQCRQLIKQWHGKGRLSFALTPRFAPTSSEAQLASLGNLLAEYPDLYMQTHLAENKDEIAWVKQLFPNTQDYLQVYEQFELVNNRALLAHGIHLSDSEINRIAQAGASIVFCPSSNLFLGSGLMGLRRAYDAGIEMSLGSDVGAGTSLSMLKTMADAYKVGQLLGEPLSALQAFYMATLGNSKAMNMSDKIGSFKVGNEADFIVLNTAATPLLQHREGYCDSLEERLFMLMMLGDDRCIQAVWVNGEEIL
jgi:guanine deaminase